MAAPLSIGTCPTVFFDVIRPTSSMAQHCMHVLSQLPCAFSLLWLLQCTLAAVCICCCMRDHCWGLLQHSQSVWAVSLAFRRVVLVELFEVRGSHCNFLSPELVGQARVCPRDKFTLSTPMVKTPSPHGASLLVRRRIYIWQTHLPHVW